MDLIDADLREDAPAVGRLAWVAVALAVELRPATVVFPQLLCLLLKLLLLGLEDVIVASLEGRVLVIDGGLVDRSGWVGGDWLERRPGGRGEGGSGLAVHALPSGGLPAGVVWGNDRPRIGLCAEG